MNDCPNGDVRDLLPEYLHDRLDAETRAMVEAHLVGCADCLAELQLLRAIRATMRRTPALDLASIQIPSYRPRAHRSWVGWRVAAAVTLIVAGGSSLVVVRSRISPIGDSALIADSGASAQESASASVVKPGTPAELPTTPSARVEAPVHVATPAVQAPVAAARRELTMGGGSLNDLSDAELASLLKDIDRLDAVTSTDVDVPATSPLAPMNGRRRAP